MEPTYDGRSPKTAATEKTAGPGGNSTNEPAKAGSPQSGAPRSWRQYIDQTMPIRDTGTAEKQEDAIVPQAGSTVKKRSRTAGERRVRRTARWARENGKKVRSFAGAVREKLGAAAAVCREKLGSAAGAARKKLGGVAAVCRKKLGPAAAVCREKLGSAAVLCGKKLCAAANLCREKLSPVVAVCRKKLEPVVALCREKLGPGAEKVRAAVARHPVSPLLYVTLLAVFIGVAAFQGNYARAYVLEANDQELGLVAGKDEVNALLSSVENRAASLLGDDFDCEVNVTLSPVYAALSDLTDFSEMEDALFEVMGVSVPTEPIPAALDEGEDEVTFLTGWVLSVDGMYLGVAPSKDVFYRMLDEIAQPWLPENTVRYEFMEDVQVYPVKLPLGTQFDDLEPIREELSALRVEEAVYTVVKGDTFNAIAYSLGMKPYELAALNPDIKVDLLMIGQKLIIQQAVPRLSVLAVTDETYEEIIHSPVEYIETADLYVGSTKVKTQGEDGLAWVNAHVTYINNKEMAREVVESTTLKEATTTYTYTGTTPKPATASKGYFIWPVKGTISSKFGYRYIFGSTSFHGGLDIAVPTGSSVKAADGGTVITATWDNSYGYYVAIRHDNGMVTVYAHNSSLLVKVGQKVYQGQIIAKSGSTGNSTGPHCHFEVRVNGTRVNPRPYLP